MCVWHYIVPMTLLLCQPLFKWRICDNLILHYSEQACVPLPCLAWYIHWLCYHPQLLWRAPRLVILLFCPTVYCVTWRALYATHLLTLPNMLRYCILTANSFWQHFLFYYIQYRASGIPILCCCSLTDCALCDQFATINSGDAIASGVPFQRYYQPQLMLRWNVGYSQPSQYTY